MGNIHFCDLCGKMLDIKLEDNKKIARCICGFFKEVESGHSSSEKMEEKESVGEGTVIEKSLLEPGFPHICKKCNYGEVDALDVGAPYSDESNVLLFRCKKCGYVERMGGT